MALLLTACMGGPTTGSTTLDDFLDREMARASADLNCPQTQVAVALVHEGSSPIGPGVDGGQVVASGCTRQVHYYNRDGRWEP